jgi:hypothetical protein
VYLPYNSNWGWHGEWFYIRNPAVAPFLAFTSRRPEKQDSWSWGCARKEKHKVGVIVEELRRSDVESELASEDLTDVDDMVFYEEEESREVVVTSAEHRDPVAMSAGDELEAKLRAAVPMPRNPPDNSTRIARGLRGSYRVHKPRVPRRPASPQRFGP